MFLTYNHPSVRLTGRFHPLGSATAATAPGSYIEIAFKGNFIRLSFDIKDCEYPFPHISLTLDGGPLFEAAIDRYLRVDCEEGEHLLKVIYKGGKERHNRWEKPLAGKFSFIGAEVDYPAELAPDMRKTIEFVGDSITEGVLIDAFLHPFDDDQWNRPFQDDVTATYDYLTAKALNLRDLHMGYGAVGATKAGVGGVPKAAEAYPYCFSGAPVLYGDPDFILINHGANDRRTGTDLYVTEYEKLLDLIVSTHPTSKIVCLSAFCGFGHEELGKLVAEYNAKNGTDIFFIDSTGWVTPEPLHPLRDGHKTIAAHLIPILKAKFDL